MSLRRVLARNLHGLGLAVVRVHRRTFNLSQNLPVIRKHTEKFFDQRMLLDRFITITDIRSSKNLIQDLDPVMEMYRSTSLKLDQYVSPPYLMKIYTELNSATWLRLVKFTKLNVSKF